MANFEFKPFDKVLVRNRRSLWIPAFYGMKSENNHLTSAGWQDECIPYEGNEEYLGTNNNYVDKVSKFKVGNWLVENEPNNYARFVQILEIVDIQGKKRYRISRDIHNDKDIVEFRFIEKYYHKFDVQDAKCGDVLHASSFSSDCIFIFARIDKWKFDEPNGERAVATGHCCLTLSAYSMEFGIQGPDCIEIDTVKPATKIQRDSLFQKMHEAGYMWDSKKLELKKREQKSSKWSEIEPIIQHLDNLGNTAMADILRSFEPQPKQEWSEEDDVAVKDICDKLNRLSRTYVGNESIVCQKEIKWLKSLRPQSAWKPSIAQLNALSIVSKGNAPDDIEEIVSLYNDLKKLKD